MRIMCHAREATTVRPRNSVRERSGSSARRGEAEGLTGDERAELARLRTENAERRCSVRTASTRSSTAAGTRRGERCGRLDRSTRPASPSSRWRRTHLCTVVPDTHNSAATCETGGPVAAHSPSNLRACTVNRALVRATPDQPSTTSVGTTTAIRTPNSLGRPPRWPSLPAVGPSGCPVIFHSDRGSTPELNRWSQHRTRFHRALPQTRHSAIDGPDRKLEPASGSACGTQDLSGAAVVTRSE